MSEWVEHQIDERVLVQDELYTLTQVARTRWGSKTYRMTSGDGVSRWLTPRKTDQLAPYVDRASIDQFVRAFYGRVQHDEVLAPIFATRITDWEPHLVRMVHFWSAILLAAPGFMGNPMQKHRELEGVHPEDFERWLRLFRATLADIFEPEVAETILQRARRIADRLSGAMFQSERACG
ncbi:MAG: group III truncated hemoglobin [Myxococcales bacterium]|nr:group III truncated hemoglobin [Myxococcales bacterium]MCB9630489.1 group III truncated hemoglobin [Sandaracinaceae bacterium]